jgi:ATP-binding cassette subfamily B protein
MKRLQDLLSLTPAIEDSDGPPLAPGPLSLDFDAVSFAYDGNEQVLYDVTASVPVGEVVGVLGRTGSGKTTLARLLARFYEPSSGRIVLSGRDISSVPLRNLRQRVGFVTQDVQVFKATLRDNVRLFDQSVTDEQVTEALETVGLGGWLHSLPKGLDTVMERDGSGLSAGEAQLLALSRVFLRDPGLVVLDEASSRIDPATERLLQKAIDRLLSGRTGFIIAHRLSTLDRADWILILEDGRVCEFGRRKSLAADPHSRYSRLLRAGIEEVLG